jgi:hypothetical protein
LSLLSALPTRPKWKIAQWHQVSYETQDIGDSMGAVLLQNYGKQDVNCTAVFQNGPETPKVRKTLVPAGKTSNLTVSFGRAIIKLRVKLTCNPA